MITQSQETLIKSLANTRFHTISGWLKTQNEETMPPEVIGLVKGHLCELATIAESVHAMRHGWAVSLDVELEKPLEITDGTVTEEEKGFQYRESDPDTGIQRVEYGVPALGEPDSVTPTTKKCGKCKKSKKSKKSKKLANFGNKKTNRDGFQNHCRKCMNLYKAAWNARKAAKKAAS